MRSSNADLILTLHVLLLISLQSQRIRIQLDKTSMVSVVPSRQHAFKVVTPNRIYTFAAANEWHKLAWIRAIHLSILQIRARPEVPAKPAPKAAESGCWT